jgi:carbamoyl-phosphate synthase small subunit
MPRPAHLVLRDGTTFEGVAYGAEGVAVGEVVFTTGMTGYQEVLTDPSYAGQIVTMTAPEIGNTGTNRADAESSSGKPQVAGFIVRNGSSLASSYRSEEPLDAYFARHGIVALSGVDTRRLTRHLRDHGAQNGAIGSVAPAELHDRALAAPPMEGLDLVGRVTSRESFTFAETTPEPFRTLHPGRAAGARVVALDLGMKRNILRSLVDVGCQVTVVPASTKASDLLALSPSGVFLSNGPGDPAAVTYAIDTVRELLGKVPIFGICLGHQLLSLASGAKTYKLKFGHRGLNQPVKNLATGRVEVTSQNHGFAVDVATLPDGVESSYVHLNDGTSEGIDIPGARAFSVQFHPEAAAGPHDTLHLFERFASMLS